MAYLLILLGVIALAAAGALLISDSRERTTRGDQPTPIGRGSEVGTEPDAHTAPAPAPASAPTPAQGSTKLDLSELNNEPEAIDVAIVEEPAPTEPTEPTQPTEPAAEEEPAQPAGLVAESTEPVVAQAPEATDIPEPTEPAEITEIPTAPRTPTRPHRRSGLQLPGSSRRERRAWAQRHGFDFAKQDEFLTGEWSRGAAASGAVAKDVVSGSAYGHETFLMDMGGVTVIAMRTGEVSDIFVDLRRDGFYADPSGDLVEVAQIGPFTVHATDAGPVARFIDVRVTTALEQFPQSVSAVWFESEWVLAQAEHGTAPEEWDDMLAPLALLADAARVLPPRTWNTIEPEYPTREMGEAIEPGSDEDTPEESTPLVQRPDEPVELPTRTTGTVRGVIDHRAIGGDEVEPIADGTTRPDSVSDLTRVRRDQTPPSIFGD
ncbi:hypothetical protein [Corynebacterium sp.]|uniref:hypothetical protein n=1 Tax=Corynebacterium sp. TaxID=1720 RepID=UPI002A90EBBF|nr:hypothetical protein [Corynebacterium sp.]MDY5784581.1 hypothetical protein [Corynebacterium sp.]